jgi:asparagine synthase (glutamine-hydrolysing)
MSAIFGIFNLDKKPVEKDIVKEMMHELAHWKPDKTDFYLKNNIGLGHLQLYDTPESKHENQPCEDNKMVITANARIDNRDELISQTGLKGSKKEEISDSFLILKAYQKWGDHCAVYLKGDFAFAIWDNQKKQLFCARDHAGLKPFYYYLDNKKYLFASEIKGIIKHPDVKTTINEQWIADSISTVKSQKDKTFFNEIFRLPPAHYLIIKPDRKIFKKYWDLAPKRQIKLKKEEDYINAFREKLFKAIQSCLRSDYPVGAELSGGLDSSSIVGIATNKWNYKQLKIFAHCLPEAAKTNDYPVKDEIEFINELTEFSGLKDIHFITAEDKDILKTMKKALKIQDVPRQQSFYLFSDALHESAEKQKVRVLLSGFGGDELVSSHAPGYLNDIARQKQWSKLSRELWKKKKNSHSAFLKPLIKNYLSTQAPFLVKFVQKITPHKEDIKNLVFEGLAIQEEFLHRMEIRERYDQYKWFAKRQSLSERQYDRITHNHVSQRLEYSGIAAHSHQIEYRYPLLDKDLIEFYIALPMDLKAKDGWTRYIMRMALEGLIPEKLRWRNDKTGATIPGVFYRYRNDYENIKNFIIKMQDQQPNNYIDYIKYLEWAVRMYKYDLNNRIPPNPGAFYNILSILMYQNIVGRV